MSSTPVKKARLEISLLLRRAGGGETNTRSCKHHVHVFARLLYYRAIIPFVRPSIQSSRLSRAWSQFDFLAAAVIIPERAPLYDFRRRRQSLSRWRHRQPACQKIGTCCIFGAKITLASKLVDHYTHQAESATFCLSSRAIKSILDTHNKRKAARSVLPTANFVPGPGRQTPHGDDQTDIWSPR